MLPQSGRIGFHDNAFDPNDTWDKHIAASSSAKVPMMPQKVPSAELKTASQQDVIAAFGQSDVSSFAIKDRELLDSGHRFVRTQYKQHANAAIEQNILLDLCREENSESRL